MEQFTLKREVSLVNGRKKKKNFFLLEQFTLTCEVSLVKGKKKKILMEQFTLRSFSCKWKKKKKFFNGIVHTYK